MISYDTPLATTLLMLLLIVINVYIIFPAGNIHASPSSNQEWKSSFNLEDCNLSPNGSNSYFILEPGYQLVLEGQEDGAQIQLKISVLNETKIVNGTEARVVEEEETEGGGDSGDIQELVCSM